MNSSPKPPQPPPSQLATSPTPRMAPTRNLTPLPSQVRAGLKKNTTSSLKLLNYNFFFFIYIY
ncbi:hypothetical protein E1A91_A09G101700v1 [Gossypium mustelinum]|uniref:Uncharacterized protein n=1 Tax=Gossypium mustelinum TaxID=34275 RepID=A0A5D2XVK3_GOSMU|nr:hypothetical protein E1A91_A09G101700v1 [Gossypium mustelinum]